MHVVGPSERDWLSGEQVQTCLRCGLELWRPKRVGYELILGEQVATEYLCSGILDGPLVRREKQGAVV